MYPGSTGGIDTAGYDGGLSKLRNLTVRPTTPVSFFSNNTVGNIVEYQWIPEGDQYRHPGTTDFVAMNSLDVRIVVQR